MSKELQYGLGRVVPDAARAAWGCRMIVTQDGYTDVVWDRVAMVGETVDREELLERLNDVFPMPVMRRVISEKLMLRELDTRVGGDVTLIDDSGVTVVCNTNGSGGYLYVAAWLTALPTPDASEALTFDEAEAAGVDATLRTVDPWADERAWEARTERSNR